MKLLIDNDNETTLAEFIADNTAPDVEMPSQEDLHAVVTMKVGESVYCGMLEVKRVG